MGDAHLPENDNTENELLTSIDRDTTIRTFFKPDLVPQDATLDDISSILNFGNPNGYNSYYYDKPTDNNQAVLASPLYDDNISDNVVPNQSVMMSPTKRASKLSRSKRRLSTNPPVSQNFKKVQF